MERIESASIDLSNEPAIPVKPLRPGAAMRDALALGYTAGDLRADVMAGLVVGVVALPLSMALAIASGVPPQHGLYTAIVAGGLIALLGGSRVQVSGPTAAFVVILAPISAKFGVGGLLLATLMAGAMLVLMGVCRLGRLIQFIPYPVTTGFTAGIAVVIATLQVKDLLGLTVASMPDHFPQRVAALVKALPTLSVWDLIVGVMALAVMVFWPRVTRRIPTPLVMLVAVTLAAVALDLAVERFHVATIGSRFTYDAGGVVGHGVPRTPPMPAWPWSFPGPDGKPLVMSVALIESLLPSAFAIAMLGAIESLLSAVVADGMTGHSHDPDAELLAQGVGNLAAPFFGGIAATGAIARTATNIRSGARSPVSAVVHAAFVLLAVVLLAPLLAYLPMAALAALLLIVAWNMSEARHFIRMVRIAPRSDVIVLLACFALTIVFDMVVAVTAGIVLAALLFMNRMAHVADVKLIAERHHALDAPLPPGVLVYEIAGPLFFGAAQKAMSSLRTLGSRVKLIVLDMRSVPVMDATGLVNLESAVDRVTAAGARVILAGVQRQPLHVLAKSHFRRHRDRVTVIGSFEAAIQFAWLIAPDIAEEHAPTAAEHAAAG